MPLNLCNYEKRTREAVKAFWGNRELARQKQIEAGKVDQGNRASVTAGKNMDGFVALMKKIVEANGLKDATVTLGGNVLTLPGFFRPTKRWDMLVLHRNRLIGALEFKSQVGSFGNNFNNRTEEALGTAHDFWTAYREGGLGEDAPKPFLGWLILVEDAPASRTPVTDRSPHFPVREEFVQASYATRYDLLCKKLVRENLYTASCLLLSPRNAATSGRYTELSELTGLQSFVTALAAHVAAEASKTTANSG
jgi:hypothetical protein